MGENDCVLKSMSECWQHLIITFNRMSKVFFAAVNGKEIWATFLRGNAIALS